MDLQTLITNYKLQTCNKLRPTTIEALREVLTELRRQGGQKTWRHTVLLSYHKSTRPKGRNPLAVVGLDIRSATIAQAQHGRQPSIRHTAMVFAAADKARAPHIQVDYDAEAEAVAERTLQTD